MQTETKKAPAWAPFSINQATAGLFFFQLLDSLLEVVLADLFVFDGDLHSDSGMTNAVGTFSGTCMATVMLPS